MGDDLRKEIEALSEAMVLADVSDLRALADLHTHFENVGRLAENEGPAGIAEAVSRATDLIESIILEETDDPEAVLDIISRTVAVLQQVVLDDLPADKIDFPDELGLSNAKKSSDAEEHLDVSGTSCPVVDPSLIGEFVTEAMEHLDSADINLLEIEGNPHAEEALHAVFRAFHTIKGVAGFLALDEIRKVSHEAETLLDSARKSELELRGPALDVTFESVRLLRDMVMAVRSSLETGQPLQPEPRVQNTAGKIKNVLAGDPAPDLEDNISQDPADDESTTSDKSNDTIATRLPVSINPRATRARESVKVPSNRLDRLVDTIGELVITQTMLAGTEEARDPGMGHLTRLVGRMSRITRELQTMGTSLRMVPIRSVFQKMSVLARDLARKSGKKINFVTSGEETELDKTIIDRISDPLIHLVRNAIDHGIESDPSERIKAGKSEAGTVELRAFHRGGDVYIEIEDDGRGIDRQAVLESAISKGIVDEGKRLSDWDIYHLVLSPGFSTAPQVTDISGRGVGMDVVRDSVEALRGHIEIRSEEGGGSIFTVRLPLTLAIIDGLVVRAGCEKYIVPTTSVIRSMRLSEQRTDSLLNSGEVLVLDDGLVPLIRLREIFNIVGDEPGKDNSLVVVVEADGRNAGLIADGLIGTQQTVIKSLGRAFRQVMGISGGAIMPDGKIGLILDVDSLVDLAYGKAAHKVQRRHSTARGFTGSEAGGQLNEG